MHLADHGVREHPLVFPNPLAKALDLSPLKVCLVSAEVTPFAKTGGLGDVTAALARHLHRLGVDVRLFFPFYSITDTGPFELLADDSLRHVPVRFGERELVFSVFDARLPRTDLDVHLIHAPDLYHRPGIYTNDVDEHLRFAFLSRAAIESCQRLDWSPDIFHCNDWHTGLLPLYLKSHYAWDDLFTDSRTVLTIHNVGYQGVFPASAVEGLELGDQASLLDEEDLEAGRLNFLKTGILHADLLTTVSPTHAKEIQTAEYGCGLDRQLRARSDDLVGVLNGVEYEEWDPVDDPLIPFAYSRRELAGKEKNKQALLDELSLPADSQAPVVGVVSRLAEQKGFGLFPEVLPELLAARDLHLVVLGTGEERYEEFFRELESRDPMKVSFTNTFDNALAHRIEAGSDLFLMPSLYEPCGLNQMYSLRYGTVPVVRKVGGLADSVIQYDAETGNGTGFLFEEFSAAALRRALEAALDLYPNPERWQQLMRNGMAKDFSWDRQIRKYVDLYRRRGADEAK
ncbi:MAG: glycogen synthase [Acidobacteria bacterium]|nr:MAG: glycogen synthase [Acidobacteriota bacterium]